jgi:hypothetical protein
MLLLLGIIQYLSVRMVVWRKVTQWLLVNHRIDPFGDDHREGGAHQETCTKYAKQAHTVLKKSE